MEYSGLTSAEAVTRLRKNGKNVLKEEKKRNPLITFVSQFKDFLTLVLLGSTVVTVFMGEYTEALTIGAIVLLNGVMGFVQEIKTEKTLEALKKMASPYAKVFRDNKTVSVPGENIVVDDLLVLEAGDKVSADATVLKANRLTVDESMLTGESVPVEKERDNDIFAGTSVISGRCTARVTKTGMETRMGGIAKMMNEIKEEETPLQKRLDELGKIIAIGCLLICFVVSLAGILRGEKLFDMLLTGVSLAVAAVPEGLPAIVTVSLALAVNRMVKRKSLIRKLHAVESLGCADVICSDKTGTLTENKMTVEEIYLSGEVIKVTGDSFKIDNKLVNVKNSVAGQMLLKSAVLCNNAFIRQEKRGFSVTGSPTEGALLVMAKNAGVLQKDIQEEFIRKDEIPFDSRRKMMSVLAENRQGEGLVVTKGAVEIILPKCVGVMLGDKTVTMTVTLREDIEKAASGMAKRGLRVIAIGYKFQNEILTEDSFVFIGLTAMMDPPRKEAKEAVSKCKKAGIKTVMITGDHKDTAAAIAEKTGIFHSGDEILTGNDIEAMSDEELGRIIEKVTVFARVSPHHKLKIVRAFKKKGHIVAMTGDGVNDAPAIKEADIGVSMGVNGTDVTKEASDVILLDDNFNTLATAVEEGRTIYANIRKFIRYLLSCNIGEVLTMFLGIIMGMPVILLPIHILLVNLVTDGLPAIALGLEPGEKSCMKRRPRRANESIFSNGLLGTIIFRGSLIGLTTTGVFSHLMSLAGDIAVARSGALLTLVLAQLVHVFECKSEEKTIFTVPFFNNFKLIGAVFLSVAIIFAVIYYSPCQGLFKTVALGKQELLTVLLYTSFAPLLSSFVQWVSKAKKSD